MNNKKEILNMLTSIKCDMKNLHNIDYSSAYQDLTKVIKLINDQPIKKIAIVSNMNRKNKIGKVKDLLENNSGDITNG